MDDGSRTIRVIKRDGSEESFDPSRVAAAIYRAGDRTPDEFRTAAYLTGAIETYLCRNDRRRVSSSAILEMSLKVLNAIGRSQQAEAMEAWQARRADARAAMKVRYEDGRCTMWDKSFCAALARQTWSLSARSGRILAGLIEADLLADGVHEILRGELQERINVAVTAWGLGEAVPVESHVV